MHGLNFIEVPVFSCIWLWGWEDPKTLCTLDTLHLSPQYLYLFHSAIWWTDGRHPQFLDQMRMAQTGLLHSRDQKSICFLRAELKAWKEKSQIALVSCTFQDENHTAWLGHHLPALCLPICSPVCCDCKVISPWNNSPWWRIFVPLSILFCFHACYFVSTQLTNHC